MVGALLACDLFPNVLSRAPKRGEPLFACLFRIDPAIYLEAGSADDALDIETAVRAEAQGFLFDALNHLDSPLAHQAIMPGRFIFVDRHRLWPGEFTQEKVQTPL